MFQSTWWKRDIHINGDRKLEIIRVEEFLGEGMGVLYRNNIGYYYGLISQRKILDFRDSKDVIGTTALHSN